MSKQGLYLFGLEVRDFSFEEPISLCDVVVDVREGLDDLVVKLGVVHALYYQ